jgi:heptose-I-phosphate ethanolaminephosphotransferase
MVYDNCDQYARNLNPKTRNEITQQFEIPFWIWCSPMFKEQHAELFEKIKKARNLPFMTDNIDQMMVSLGGISTDFYRPEDDPLNEKYDRKRKRIIMGGIDYDKIIRGQ